MKAFIALFAGVMVALVVRAILSTVPGTASARVVHLLASACLLYGCVGFFGQAAAAMGALAFLPASFEWPVVGPETSASDASGGTFVGLASSGRVQHYDPQGRFIRGWFVPAAGGTFKLRVGDSGNVEVFTSRGRRRLMYAASGELLEEGTHAESVGGGIGSLTRGTRAPWLLWPVGSPFVAWALFAAGGVGVAMFGRPRHTGRNADA
jgi:hypothetical protein